MTFQDKVQRALAMGAYNRTEKTKTWLDQTFEIQNQMLKESEEMKRETAPRNSYDIAPATLGEISIFYIATGGLFESHWVPYSCTERSSGKTKFLLMEPGKDPADLSDEEIAERWAKFAQKH